MALIEMLILLSCNGGLTNKSTYADLLYDRPIIATKFFNKRIKVMRQRATHLVFFTRTIGLVGFLCCLLDLTNIVFKKRRLSSSCPNLVQFERPVIYDKHEKNLLLLKRPQRKND